jgi:hypothetical protein
MPKVKTIKIKSKKREKEIGKIGDLMKNMLQTDRNSDDYSNIQVIFDKYVKLRGLLEAFLRNITTLLVKVNNGYLNQQTKHYRDVIAKEFRKYCKIDITPYQNTLDIMSVGEDKLRLLRNVYIDLRDSFITLTSIMVAKNILSCKLDGKSLNKKGKYEEFCDLAFKGDIELRIFNYIKVGELRSSIDFDFCVIFGGGNTSMKYDTNTKREIFAIITSLCENGRDIDKIKNSADIDVADIFPKLLEVVRSFKSQMRGCERAFSIIENSADIFEKNCNKYIRKATKTGNPMGMFTEFVGDIISQNTEKAGDGESVGLPVMGELKKILREMRQKIESVSGSVGIPENIRFVVDIADTIIEEHENNVDGTIPGIQEIRNRQREFSDIFIP